MTLLAAGGGVVGREGALLPGRGAGELAGARAASVVRLLEQEGVPSEQLLAISFGENSPVASNDTPESRSKNRRIEIVLRPVAVTMN